MDGESFSDKVGDLSDEGQVVLQIIIPIIPFILSPNFSHLFTADTFKINQWTPLK